MKNHNSLFLLFIFSTIALLSVVFISNATARDPWSDIPKPRTHKEKNQPTDEKELTPGKKFDAPKAPSIDRKNNKSLPQETPQTLKVPKKHLHRPERKNSAKQGSVNQDSRERSPAAKPMREITPKTMHVTPLNPPHTPPAAVPREHRPEASDKKSWDNLLDMPDRQHKHEARPDFKPPVFGAPSTKDKDREPSTAKQESRRDGFGIPVPKVITPPLLHWQDGIIIKHRHSHSHNGHSHNGDRHHDHGPRYGYYHRHRYAYYRTPWYNTWYLAPIVIQLPLVGDVLKSLPRGHTTIRVQGYDYYYHEGVFYYPYRDRYVIVSAPIGAEIELLPLNVIAFTINNDDYYFANNTYYLWDEQHEIFVVVNQPLGAAEGIAESTALRLHITPRRNQNIDRQSRDRFECHNIAVSDTGIDPVLETHEYHWSEIERYQRAMSYCLEDRGYIVQ